MEKYKKLEQGHRRKKYFKMPEHITCWELTQKKKKINKSKVQKVLTVLKASRAAQSSVDNNSSPRSRNACKNVC